MEHYDEQKEKQLSRNKILEMLKEVKNDTMQVFDFGAKKHPDSGPTPNFLTPEGNKCSLKERGSSVLRHAASAFMNPGALDSESNLQHLLHLLASASILYIRHKRNIIHPSDEQKIQKRNFVDVDWSGPIC